MYLADSARGLILRLAPDPTTGDLGEPEVFARVEGGSPDGMTVDDDGHLWSAVWGGARLDRYAPDGTLTGSVPVPARQPTSVLITPDRRILDPGHVGHGRAGRPRPGRRPGLRRDRRRRRPLCRGVGRVTRREVSRSGAAGAATVAHPAMARATVSANSSGSPIPAAAAIMTTTLARANEQ
jgi:hypothetical protein